MDRSIDSVPETLSALGALPPGPDGLLRAHSDLLWHVLDDDAVVYSIFQHYLRHQWSET